MGLLSGDTEENAMEALANADAGLKKALMRLNELADLLERAAPHTPHGLAMKIREALRREFRDHYYDVAVSNPWQWERVR